MKTCTWNDSPGRQKSTWSSSGKGDEGSKDYEVKKNIDGTIKITQANATGLKYSRQPRQVRVSTYSFIWTFETVFGESWENPKCIWDDKLLRLHFRPLCTGCAAEDEDRYCPVLKDAQYWWLMCFTVKAEVVKYSQGPGKNQICWLIPHSAAQPGNFGYN